jgi:hypothetical protein
MNQATITTDAFVEKGNDGMYSCFTTSKIENCALAGYGDTPNEAINDMLASYEEIKEMNAEDGLETPNLEFVYKFDIPSFFAYFDCINISKFSRLAGINASLMRQYASGKANAGDAQVAKIKDGINKFKNQLDKITL